MAEHGSPAGPSTRSNKLRPGLIGSVGLAGLLGIVLNYYFPARPPEEPGPPDPAA